MRYFLHLAYNGFHFRGWQRQPNAISVQEILEGSLQKIFKKPVPCLGCGRTDALVHASQYFAHINLDFERDFDLKFRLNKVLPEYISIFDIIPVEDVCNARFDATERTYDYFVHFYKDPFLFGKSSFINPKPLDLKKMKQATNLLLKYNDFRSYCICPDNHNTTICNVSSSNLFVDKNESRLRFQITANRFLRCMIRVLMAKLLEVGEGKMSLDNFEDLLATQKTPPSLRPAPPQGLYLSKVVYPYLDIPTYTEFMGMMQRDEIWKKL